MNRQSGCAFALLLTTIASPGITQTPTSGLGFDSMAQPEEPVAECTAPRPPRELAETAYIRNGYRAILRILAARHWQETGDCTCVVQGIPWDEVVTLSAEFVTNNDPLRPFDTSELRLMADGLEAQRATACRSR